MQMPANPFEVKDDRASLARQNKAQRTSMLVLLALSSAWLLLCIVFLAVLIPPLTAEGLVLRCLVAVIPIPLLWIFLAAGQGRNAALLALLLIMLVVTDLSLRNRAYSDTSMDAQTLSKTAIWGMGLLVALLNWRALVVALREPAMALITSLCLWFIVTSSYSPIRAYSYGSSIAMLSVILFGAAVRQKVSDRLILTGAITAIGALLWLSLVLYVVVPSRAMVSQEAGQVLRLAAPFGNPNGLGRAAALVFMLCAVAVLDKQLRWRSPLLWAMGFAALACLFLSNSRTAAVALVGGLGLVMLIRRPARLVAAGIVVAATTLVLMFVDLNLTELASMVSRSGNPSDVATLTGRTAIWSFVWGEIEKSPWLGYGYSSTRHLIPLLYQTFWGWTATHAHNMWLQLWFVSGVIGVTLLFGVIVAQFRYCLQTRDSASLALLGFVFVMGLTEAGHLDGAPSILTILWGVFLVGRRQHQTLSVPSGAPILKRRPSTRLLFPSRSAKPLQS